MSTFDILMRQLSSMWTGFIALLPNIGIALVLIVITALVARLCRPIAARLTQHAHIRESLKQLVDTAC